MYVAILPVITFLSIIKWTNPKTTLYLFIWYVCGFFKFVKDKKSWQNIILSNSVDKGPTYMLPKKQPCQLVRAITCRNLLLINHQSHPQKPNAQWLIYFWSSWIYEQSFSCKLLKKLQHGTSSTQYDYYWFVVLIMGWRLFLIVVLIKRGALRSNPLL